MNIKAEGYTREQIEAALFSSSRQVRFEYIAFKATGEFLGNVEIQDGVISYDSTSEVMRTFTGTMKESELINSKTIDCQIVPYMCLMMFNGKEARFPLGRFVITTSKNLNNNVNTLNINGYDLSKIALDDKSSDRFYAGNDATYKHALDNLLLGIYSNIEIVDNEINKSFSQDWDIGTSKLTIANDLLKGMNYNPLYFDEEGKAWCTPYLLPTEKGIDFQYISDKTSVIVDGMTLVSNQFDIPNKWIRYTENPEAPYLMSIYINDSENNPYSTVNRNRVIVDSQVVEDIASQVELDAYTRREAALSMQETFTLEFSTLNMPGHGFREVLWVDVKQYNIADVFVEVSWEMELSPGGMMRHVCKRVESVWD